jgi:hypothetical protein
MRLKNLEILAVKELRSWKILYEAGMAPEHREKTSQTSRHVSQ